MSLKPTSLRYILLILCGLFMFLWLTGEGPVDLDSVKKQNEVIYRHYGTIQQPRTVKDDMAKDHNANSQDEARGEGAAAENLDQDRPKAENIDENQDEERRNQDENDDEDEEEGEEEDDDYDDDEEIFVQPNVLPAEDPEGAEWSDVEALVGVSCPLAETVQCRESVGVHQVLVKSTAEASHVCVNGEAVLGAANNLPGLTLVVVDPESGLVSAMRTFHTGTKRPRHLGDFLSEIDPNAIVAAVTFDEAAIQLDSSAKALMAKIGSWQIDALEVGGAWAIVGLKDMGYPTLYEEVGQVKLHLDPYPNLGIDEIPEDGAEDIEEVDQPIQIDEGTPNGPVTAYTGACISEDAANDEGMRRESLIALCSKPYGRSNFCQTHTSAKLLSHIQLTPEDMTFNWPQPAEWDTKLTTDLATKVPIVIVAGDRTNYLIRHLKSLIKQPGLDLQMVGIYTDGVHEDIAHVARVFGVHVYAHTKSVSMSNKNDRFQAADRIAMNYRFALGKVWKLYPGVEQAIVLEEDLELSPDFLYYFSQTIPMLAQDPNLLSISAWNDNSMEWTSHDPSRLYLSEFFTGLGWVLTKKLWGELEVKWPQCCQGFSWDLWLRHNANTKGRRTIIPDVSRTFHFGRKGSNVNNDFFYVLYFLHHSFNTNKYTQIADMHRMTEAEYDEDLDELFSKAIPVAFGGDAHCPYTIQELPEALVLPNDEPDYQNPIVVWYEQGSGKMRFKNLEKLISCFKMWDLGKARCYYKNVLRGFYGSRHLILAGTKSPWAKKYKNPDDHAVRINVDRKKRMPSKKEIAEVKKLRGLENV